MALLTFKQFDSKNSVEIKETTDQPTFSKNYEVSQDELSIRIQISFKNQEQTQKAVHFLHRVADEITSLKVTATQHRPICIT